MKNRGDRARPAGDIGRILMDRTLVERALRRAAREAIRLHKKMGQPLVVAVNGETRLINADLLEA